MRRRNRAIKDVYFFLTTYFPEVFYQDFTPQRREMIEAILRAARYGGDQAIAGPRGDGKTRSALYCALFLCVAGQLSFPLVIAKSGPRAKRELRNLKDNLEVNKLFAADFPEIGVPVHALGRWASRARSQTVWGHYTRMEWAEEVVILPDIPSELLRENGWPKRTESAARGQILSALGIEGPIRGYSVRDVRPDVAILDDVDDRESARSEVQTEQRNLIIEEDVGGLAGPDRTIGRVMLCTLITSDCTAATYTDREKKPSWNGKRYKLVNKWPDREELWDDYMELRRHGQLDGDPLAREAHQLYLQKRQAMDAGSEVSNPDRYSRTLCPDGSQLEVSTLQHCYNIVCDRGRDHFDCEYQNNPKEDDRLMERKISAYRVQTQVSGCKRKLIPADVSVITQGIDVGKYALHWVVKAWRADASGFVVDYGVQEVRGTQKGDDDAVDLAIYRALCERRDHVIEDPYIDADQAERPIDMTVIDAHYRENAVLHFIAQAGTRFAPAMGFGQSGDGATRANFRMPSASKDRRPGDHWFLSRQPSGVWIVCMDSDYWKGWLHDRWTTPTTEPGTMMIFGQKSDDPRKMSLDQRGHFSFAKHITAEVEAQEVVKGRLVQRFVAKSDTNHYLDASYMAAVGGSMCGIRLMGNRPAGKKGKAVRLSDLQAARRHA